jgi:hypothetical protein
MNRSLTLILALGAASLSACSDDLGPGTPNSVVIDGIRYTASVNEIIANNGSRQFTIIVTLSNQTSEVKTRTYPAACPVRVLLYRAADDFLVYDEEQRPCSATPTATVTISGSSTATLQSGIRFTGTVAGDSLPLTTYTARALVKTEGSREVIVNAGTVNLGT